jgi:hypothetical protein
VRAAAACFLFARDFVCRLAQQFKEQRVEKLRFEDVFQTFQGRYSDQEVRVSLAKMVRLLLCHVMSFASLSHSYFQCAEGLLFEEEVDGGSMLFHLL